MARTMPPDKKAALIAIGDSLRGSPKAWRDIAKANKDTIKELLRPVNGFSQDQREFISKWYIEVTQATVDAINAAMPPHTICEPRVDNDGKLFLSCDLFTDAEDGGRLKDILPLIQSITLVHKTDDQWPVQEQLP